jgi:hypothetical protein
MSKQNPNQIYYKTGGRGQTDGPDRVHAVPEKEKQEFTQIDKDAKHPAIRRAKRK